MLSSPNPGIVRLVETGREDLRNTTYGNEFIAWIGQRALRILSNNLRPPVVDIKGIVGGGCPLSPRYSVSAEFI